METPTHYNDVCQKTSKGVNSSNFPRSKSQGLAVHISSGYGDGLYQAWGHKDETGRIVKVEIDMRDLDTRIKKD